MKKQTSVKGCSTWFLVAMMVIGLVFLLYPAIADRWNTYHETKAITNYVSAVNTLDENQFETLWNDAEVYNQTLLTKDNRYVLSEKEKEEYNQLLDITSTGIMAYLEIPKIHVTLPIYHGTDETTLQVASGHIPGTSLPIGGESTHCVLSGHRGLPSARLFTDLDQLTAGDTFTIDTLGKTLTYEVDQIHIVLPDELDDLEIVPDKDYVTLVTCTPYGINSHRLLVRGTRIQTKETLRITAEAAPVSISIVTTVLIVTGGIILVILSVLYRIFAGR